MSGTVLTAAPVEAASAFELALGASAESLEADPLFAKAYYASNAMDLSAAPLVNSSAYHWKARIRGRDGAWGEWSAPYSFKVEWTNPAAAPTPEPAAGIYKKDQAVVLGSATAGTVIRYTTDGSEPTAASRVYSGPIKVAGHGATKTIKAIALAPGFAASPASVAKFSIKYPAAAAPVMSPAEGSFPADQAVTLASATKGATIRYTTDGSEPGVRSPPYSRAIKVVGGVVSVLVSTAATLKLGENSLMYVISATIIGGTAMSGGKGGVLRTVVAIMSLEMLYTGIILFGLGNEVKIFFAGLILA